MTKKPIPQGNIDFLIRLQKIDKHALTIRDVLVLYYVIGNPGCAGVEVAAKLGFENRSCIAGSIIRLIREGYIEDHREVRRKANPTILHALPKGLSFWDEIKP